jgi:hypothetical protein
LTKRIPSSQFCQSLWFIPPAQHVPSGVTEGYLWVWLSLHGWHAPRACASHAFTFLGHLAGKQRLTQRYCGFRKQWLERVGILTESHSVHGRGCHQGKRLQALQKGVLLRLYMLKKKKTSNLQR